MTSTVISPAVLKQKFIQSSSPTHLGLAVSATEQCNFRCTYCYEDFEIGEMSDATYTALKLFVAKRMPQLKSFTLSWFGGEPLLALDKTVDFTRYCNDLAAQYGVRMPRATMPTNASALTPKNLVALVDAGVRHFMISLDGQADAHNQTRKTIGGKPTFDRVYRNLLAVRACRTEQPFEILLRLHLHENNIASQLALAEQLSADFAADSRFDILPIAVGDFGGAPVKSLALLRSNSDSIKGEIYRRFGRGNQAAAQEEWDVCYAAKWNHLFIRPDGRISKCTSALNRADNDIGRLLENGEIEFDEQKALLWGFGFQTGKKNDLDCPFFDKPQEQTPIRFYSKTTLLENTAALEFAPAREANNGPVVTSAVAENNLPVIS
jgi:uncharacterized protein